MGRFDIFFRFLFHHSFLDIFQTVSLGLWYENADEKDADEAEETKKPEGTMGSDRRYQVVKEFGYSETASPIKCCSYRRSVTTDFAWENFSHLNETNKKI